MKSNMKVLLESWRGYVTEEEHDEDELGAAEADEEVGAQDAMGDAEADIEDAGEDVDDAMQDKVEALVDAIAGAIEDETGVSVEVEGEAEDAEDAEYDADTGDVEGAEVMAAEEEEDVVGEAWGSKEGEYKRRDGRKAGDVEGHYKAYEDEPLEEDKAYTAKKEKPGADIRKGAEKRGAEGTKKKTGKKGEDAYVNEAFDEIVEEVTNRVAKRLVKEQLKRKLAARLRKK